MSKKVVITGGNGGIAQGIAEVLSMYSYEVYTPGRDELEVTDTIAVEKYFRTIKPDILINNAGYISASPLKDMSIVEWDEHIDVNLSGMFYCAKYAMLNGCNTIINIGSTSGFMGRPNWGAYCVAKAGTLSLTETLANEGVTCYSINPSRTKSKMRERLFPDEDQNTLMNPERIGNFVNLLLKGGIQSGSHMVVKKDSYLILPPRQGV